MSPATIATRYPTGRIVWIRVLSCWARGVVDQHHAGSVHVKTDQGFTVYVHYSCAGEIRVREPYNSFDR